jgi:hypothetical protein
MRDESMLLIDTRYSPRSMRPEWRQEALQEKYGKRYRWAGRYLGNKNFKGGPIVIADPGTGIRGLRTYLNEGHSLVLLCACAEYSTCHRKDVVELLQKAMPEVEVVHPDAMVPEDSIPCLSIQQPWSYLIVHGHKDIENRDWSTNYRGPLLIHAGAKIDGEWFQVRGDPEPGKLHSYMACRYGLKDIMPEHKSLYPTRAIVGVVDLVDVVEDSESHWFCGEYGFVLANARPMEPIPYRGALKLFPVPKSVVQNFEYIK